MMYLKPCMVGENLLIAGRKEKQLVIEQGNYHNGVPAITVVVDAGWNKRSHKHSYNANSGIGVIFGAATKALLFIGIRNKYCSVCTISTRNNVAVPPHQCYHNLSGSSSYHIAGISAVTDHAWLEISLADKRW